MSRKSRKKSKILQITMPEGHKPKRGWHNCNISGLQNQPKPSPGPSQHSSHTTPP